MVVNVYVEGGVINGNVDATTSQEKAKKSASGKVRDMRYGKLRHAPGIIAHLNPSDLINKDRELESFGQKVQKSL